MKMGKLRPAVPLAWITGARGLIGNCVVKTAPLFATQWRIRGLIREQLDLLDFDAVRQAFQRDQPRLVIHCAAMSRSTDCEQRPEQARRLNVAATTLLAELAENIPFVFFSTDLVFDGKKGSYVESDPVHPLSVYAQTKVAAEKIVLANPKHIVIRVALNAGVSPTGDRAFNEQLCRAFEKGETVKLFTDEFRCPIPAVVTARAAWELVAQNQAGLFHVAGAERLSRWEIGRLIASRFSRLNPHIEPAPASSYTGPPRPADVSLDCRKAQKVLSFPLPGFSEWLETHPEEILQTKR